MKEKNEIFNISKVRAILGFSYRTVLDLIYAGTLPASKIANKWRIQSKDLYAMLEAHKRPVLGDKEGGP